MRRTIGAVLVCMAVTVAAIGTAAANAPNPLPETTGSMVTNGDGSVTVTVSGVWNWGQLSGSSPQLRCDTRYGVGWTVDWAGVNGTPSAPGARGALLIRGTPTLYFHVFDTDMVAAGNVYAFTGACTPAELALDPPAPSGPWSATHTYADEASVPDRICANFYDLHGTTGALVARDADPLTNGDNSIRTNNFNPVSGVGDFCYFPHPDRDTTPPVVTGTPDRAANTLGWYAAPVTVTWSAVDLPPSSGTPTQPSPTVAAIEGANVGYTSDPSCDPAGNCAPGSIQLSIDTTAPNVIFSGNLGTYTVDQQIAITCDVSDALSGVASSSCDGLQAPAYNLEGTHTLVGTASDVAGNSTTASTTFTVVVTPSSLATVTTSLVTDRTLARTLTDKLARNNVRAYINQVKAESGKKRLSRQTGDLLLSLASHL